MAETQLLRGGTVLADWSAATVIADGAVAWGDGRLLAVGPRAEVEATHPGAAVHEARGGWITPGLVNAHHHLYSALAPGLDPGMPMAGFAQTLDRLWWRLDRAHDEESVRHSVRVGALRAALAGCTTVVDHHASPACIPGVLDLVAEELAAAGLSGVLCYEATDRNGGDGARAGLAESARFRDAAAGHPRFRGLIGLHAAFTLGDATLARAAKVARDGDIHIHVAEDRLDVETCRARDGTGPLQRLERHGLLGPASWIVHGVHLDGDDMGLLATRGALLVHNPESNANNGVGRLDLPRARAAGVAVGLGTDGMSPCPAGALRSAFLLHRAPGADPADGWRHVEGLLDGARAHLARLFGDPLLGLLTPGAPADIAVVDHVLAAPATRGRLTAQLVFGMTPWRVRHTVARGDFLVRDFVPCRQDAERVRAAAEPVRRALWERFAAVPAGTSYLGGA